MNNYAALTILGCWSNGITTLNVSKCTAIYNLEYESNQIAELNVSGGKFLMGLICNGNGLNGIDLIGCPDNIAIAYNGELPQVSKPTIFTENIPDATRRAPYSFMLTGLGGTTTRKWTMTRGSLPNGLKIAASTGKITGTPTQAGSFTF
ncbi:MAG: putative Ig domain-containing protein, partial [Synergistaceae bacterium]|nr:putative Ig domain-containing protein [Synergistaceae bacterium]